MSKKSKRNTQLNGYTEYVCPTCEDVFQYAGSAKDAKYFHDLEYHAEPLPVVASVVVEEPIAVVQHVCPTCNVPFKTTSALKSHMRKHAREEAAAEAERKSHPAELSFEEISAMFDVLVHKTEESAEQADKAAKAAVALVQRVRMVEAKVLLFETKLLPMLLKTPEPFRDTAFIEQVQIALAAGRTWLASQMMQDTYVMGASVADVIERKTKLDDATKAAAEFNLQEQKAVMSEAQAWADDAISKWSRLMSGSLWVPTVKRIPVLDADGKPVVKDGKPVVTKETGKIPFAYDCWWRLGSAMAQKNIKGKDRDWETTQSYIPQMFAYQMHRYCFDSHMSFARNIKVMEVDESLGVAKMGKAKHFEFEVQLPLDQWQAELTKLMQRFHKNVTKGERDMLSLCERFGCYGDGDEVVSLEDMDTGYVPKVKTNTTIIGAAMIEAQRVRANKDNVDAPQTKSHLRSGK